MNESESTINVVKRKRPKTLIGRHQNGLCLDKGLVDALAKPSRAPAKRWHLTHCVNYLELGKPVSLPLDGRETARNLHRGAGRGTLEKAKAPSVMARDRVILTRKRGRLPARS